MPTRTTAARAAAHIIPDAVRSQGLQFDEPLSWRAGTAIPVADLLRRLQALSKEMRALDQEEDGQESFAKVAGELANTNLLAHKDKGVRAWAGCCLVDILRLCAPDAPFTGPQLKDIFTLFVTSILPALGDPSNAYNLQHVYVLASLAQVKSIVLLSDLPDPEKLTTALFTNAFDLLAGSNKIVSEEQVGKSVEFNLTAILTIMVDESVSLCPEVIDIMVAQFLRIDPVVTGALTTKSKKSVVDGKQTTLHARELPPSYNMAKTVCNSCPDKMARYISQYFNDVIVDASAGSKEKHSAKRRRFSEDQEPSDMDMSFGATEEDLKDLRKAHQLLRELWRACPTVLQNVIPQLEAELSAENVHLRLLATETFGDIISGIGAAGPPHPPVLDPAAYPYANVADGGDTPDSENILTKPSSPQSFSQLHQQAYTSFLNRRNDKSPIIRAAWTFGVGHILASSAGGVGLSQQEEDRLIGDLAKMLSDLDDKVRIAAVQVIGLFNFRDAVLKLGATTTGPETRSILTILGDRMRDRKHAVRVEAMTALGRLWGVAAGEILAGDERVISALSDKPSLIFQTYLTNDLDIHALLDQVLFEQLLPLAFPPTKAKASKAQPAPSVQTTKSGERNAQMTAEDDNPDYIRTERILLLVNGLSRKSKEIFYALQERQTRLARIVGAYLQRCEEFNGGIVEKNEKELKANMTRLIDSLAKMWPDSHKWTMQLWKFAKLHDRRAYQLIRFCFAPESDYRTVMKAMRELVRRIEQSSSAPQDLLSTMLPLVYRCSIFIYNRSHVPAILAISRLETSPLAATAHEMLRDISTRTPEVLRAQARQICRYLQDEAPNSKKFNDPGAMDNLKACASFAARFDKEIPKDRKFQQAMESYALYGQPAEAAKHAVGILLTISETKELTARNLVQKVIKDFEYGSTGFVSRIAALSQLMLLAPDQTEQESDAISEIAIDKILLKNRSSPKTSASEYLWTATIDEECEAKCWALKILVNRVRSHADPDTLAEIAAPVYETLSNLIEHDGEILPNKSTPGTHKSRLRLLAGRSCLKLCTKKQTDSFLTPDMFNKLAIVAQDPLLHIRSEFWRRLKKYMTVGKLAQRFYTIPFLFAYEPAKNFKSDIMTWIRSRARYFHDVQQEKQDTKPGMVMESVFARLISLLAYHPDYLYNAGDLLDFAQYFLFYLETVANEDNASLIFHIAQRVKQSHDAITPSSAMDDRLYHLSDLAQLVIRVYEEGHNWNIETLPGKASLPRTLFSELKSHTEALSIAGKTYISDDVVAKAERIVRTSMKQYRSQNKKRRSDGENDEDGRDAKKAKTTLSVRKASASSTNKDIKKARKVSETAKLVKSRKKEGSDDTSNSTRRRSSRVQSDQALYRERDDDEDDDEMADGVAQWTYSKGIDEESVPTSEAEQENGPDQSEGTDHDETGTKGVSRVAEDPVSSSPATSRTVRSGRSTIKVTNHDGRKGRKR